MTKVPVNHKDVLYVAQNMREWDKKEIYATRWNDCPEALTDDIMRFPDFAWTFGLDRPIAALGGYTPWPGMWMVWMFATDEFQRIGLSLTRHIRKQIIPTLYQFAHRVECRSVVGHEDAQKWLEILGAKREARLEKHGKNQEDFFVYKWNKSDITG